MSNLLLRTKEETPPSLRALDKKIAISRLPEVHARVILLVEEGLDRNSIAERLGIPPEAVGPLIEVAWTKLEGLMGRRLRLRRRVSKS